MLEKSPKRQILKKSKKPPVCKKPVEQDSKEGPISHTRSGYIKYNESAQRFQTDGKTCQNACYFYLPAGQLFVF